MDQRLSALLMAVLVLCTGCVAANRPLPEYRTRQALFSWKGEKESDKDDKKEPDKNEAGGKEPGDDEPNGDKNGGERKSEEPDPIVTERPDFTNSSRTIGRNRIQLESGYTFTSDGRGASRMNSHAFLEALVRVGIFADWFEVQIGQNFLHTRAADPANPAGVNLQTGPQDLYLASKFALTKQDGILPETAVTLQMTLPTGSREQGSNKVLPGLLFLYSWDVIPDRISLAGSSVFANAEEDDHGYFSYAQSLSVGYTLTKRLSAYTECFALFPSGATPTQVGPEYYYNGGFLYQVTPNFQLDIRFGVGLNKHADDFFTGVGFAIRY
ncbi:hypothetical protein VT84_28360 [Gemmata sp. SH-PL17]|uniref:transporter n=1 Tax=Gemmata sp. SH-PL17 TaxID=1630693 RepID=UPI00078CC2F4|nr:transporter [Gemmata sp. SH-PL17]AMV28350.1 hypothetical protein VT84_28360 [Gemmata sp. SH-PL17]